jgi:transcription elongation factor GreA
MTDSIPFTPAAYQKLQDDFDRLNQEREDLLKRLQIAREMGDLSENAAYKYAKIELGTNGKELGRLRHLLKVGVVVQRKAVYDVVDFGCTVTITDGKKEKSYMIVSIHESNPVEGKLSTDSPIGNALMGKKVGDKVNVTIPAGEVTYTILKIS